jgi:hypothetical protein
LTDTGDECEHVFLWKTAAGCPLDKQPKAGPQGFSGKCSLDDPLTDHVYDFTALAKSIGDYEVHKDGVTYYINMCKVRVRYCCRDPLHHWLLIGDGPMASPG